MFPSPIGVIFSLIIFTLMLMEIFQVVDFRLLSELYSHLYKNNKDYKFYFNEFPSPIGVIFSLMDIEK